MTSKAEKDIVSSDIRHDRTENIVPCDEPAWEEELNNRMDDNYS